MMITPPISLSPYYTETQSMAISAPISSFNAPYRPAMTCPSVAMTMKMLAPKEAPLKKRRCRRVAFVPDMALVYIESAVEFTQAEKDDRWYRSEQISTFKQDARDLCRTRIDDVHNNCADTPIPKSTSSDSDDEEGTSKDSIRGLDAYYPSRQRYNKKYIQHVLEAYHVRCVGNDEHVALLAEKWSKKSLSRAIHAGKKDFLLTYFPDEMEYELLPEEKVVSHASTLIQQYPQQQQGSKMFAPSA